MDKEIPWEFDYPRGWEWVNYGGSSSIYAHPANPKEVVKIPNNAGRAIEAIEIEKRIYKRLGSHPNIVPVIRIDEGASGGIIFKRAEYGCLRQYFREGGSVTMEERIRWCWDIASALQYVHEHGIRQVDIGCRNILLDSSRTALLCDFAGSSIDGSRPTVEAQEGFKHPTAEPITIQAELHALGSTMYQIITSFAPHERFEEWMVESIRGFKQKYPRTKDCPEDKSEDWMVELWIKEGRYPDVSQVELGESITKCWKGEFGSAKEVAASIQSEIQLSSFHF